MIWFGTKPRTLPIIFDYGISKSSAPGGSSSYTVYTLGIKFSKDEFKDLREKVNFKNKTGYRLVEGSYNNDTGAEENKKYFIWLKASASKKSLLETVQFEKRRTNIEIDKEFVLLAEAMSIKILKLKKL